MKKWVKVSLIVGSSMLGLAAMIVPITLLVWTGKTISILPEIDDALPNEPPKTPLDDMPKPTLDSVKTNYDVNSLGVDVNQAKKFKSQQPIAEGSNLYYVPLSNQNLMDIFDVESKTLYFNFDPMLSNLDQDINISFYVPQNDEFLHFSDIETIIFYIKKIDKLILQDNFLKKIVFDLSTSNAPFKNFDNLKNFIVYEEEQSCFDAPSNFIKINSDSFPNSLVNIYTDASPIRFNWITQELTTQDFSAYSNLKKLIVDYNTVSWFFDVTSSFTLDLFIYFIGAGQFINTNDLKIYSTISFDFYSYEDMNNFSNDPYFGKDNPNYTGYKIPYYLDYINPLGPNSSLASFPIPQDTDSDVYKMLKADAYLKPFFFNYLGATKLYINKNLASIANVKINKL